MTSKEEGLDEEVQERKDEKKSIFSRIASGDVTEEDSGDIEFAWREHMAKSTPLRSSGEGKSNHIWRVASTKRARVEILLDTLMDQSKRSNSDTLTKMASTINELENILKDTE